MNTHRAIFHNDTERTHPRRENRTMNRLQRLFGRRVRAAGESAAETTPRRRRPAKRAFTGWATLAAGLLAAAGPQAARAAVSENFDSIFGTSSYKDQTANGWRINSGLRSGTARSGSCARTAATGSANYLQYQGSDGSGKDGGVGTISFWYRAWDTSPQPKFKVQYSVNGGSFTDIGSEISPNTTYTQFSSDLNNSSDNIIVRVQQTAGERLLIDDFSIGDYASATAPKIAVLGKDDVEITSGDSTPSTTDGTDFGSVSTSVAVTNTYTITNSGTATLTNTTPISLTGDSVFTVNANPSTTVAAGGTTTFKIKFAPTAPGATYMGLVSIANNDSANNPYTFSIKGTAPCFTSISGLRVSETNATEFTVAWDAVSGADGYVLDVSTNETFGGGGGAPKTNDFSDIGGGTTSTYLTREWTNNTDVVWTAYKARTDQTVNGNPSICLKNEAGAYLVSETIPSGISTLKFDVQQSFTGDGGKLTVYVNGTSAGTFDYDTTVQTAEFNTIDTASVTSLVISNNTAARPAINNLIWSDFGSPDYIPGYTNREVSGTSHTVTGLTVGVTYYYRLTATNTDCTAVSTTNSVTTVASTPTIVIANNGTVSAASVATGTVAHVLLKFSAAVTTANAELNTVAFTTAGTYDANDLTNLKLWYSSDSTLNTSSDDTIKTLSSPAAAGAKSFTGLSQSINAGSTGYFFITADIASGADYGHTVSVNAIANADLTFAAGNKSGSASAGGAQTFVATAPTANGTVGTFTSVGASSMVVNWTSGNGERRIVVVREGSATSWTPSDGTAPSGVDADFSSATDQANGNKICYDGTGTSFTLSGLSASTTYHVTIFEYNGTTTYVKYYTAGTEASGSQVTTTAGGIWINPTTANTPMGTYYLGDTMGEWYVQFDIGQTWWDYAQVGIGPATDGTGYDWAVANWYENGEGSNKRVQRNLNGYQYTAVGSHYVICQARANSGDTYTSKSGNGWGNPVAYPPADLSSAYFTCSALGVPTSPTAVKDGSGNTATRADLGWAQWNSKNVLITRSTAVPSGGPTQGTAYSAGNTFGNQTVVSGSQGGTALEVTGLTPGQTYYFTFYSENHSYYSAGTTATALTLDMPQARNTSGEATPGGPAGTIYLGDTAKVFTFESWGTIETAWGQGRLWLRAGNSDISGGTAGAWGGFTDQNSKSVTSGVFNATGTWYWGIQMDYGATYGTAFWYKASSASWVNLAANGTGASLSFSVSAIVNPGSQSATTASPTQINLGWAKNAVGNNVMVVRKLSTASWTEPTQGTGYTVSTALGAGTVIYNGSGTSFGDAGLTSGATYDYKFYSVNNDYYSSGVTAQATTFAAEPTIQAYNLVTNTCGVDSLGLAWTSGNGANRIVVVTEYDAAGLWLFDEGAGTTAKDSTVHANDGTLYNTPTWTTRTGGAGALNFLRTSSEYVEVLNDAALQTTNSQTISFWLRPTDFPGRQNPWNKAYGGEGTITLEPNQTLNYYWGTSGANAAPYESLGSASTLSAGQWTHVVLVRDLVNNTVRWYFNGSQVASRVPGYAAATASTANLRFGSGYAGALNGDMAEPMLLDYALTATEVADLYAMGSMGLGWEPTDGEGLAGTISANFSAATDQAYNSKIVYNGTGNSVTVTGLKPHTAYRVRVFEYNGSGATANYNTDTATDNPNTFATAVAPPTSLSAAAASATAMTLTFAANAAGHNVVIVADPDNTFSAPSGTPPAVGAAFAGGTVAYNGTSSPQTHAGLDSCTRYYYQAWSYANGRYSTAVTANDTTDTPAAPATLWASVTNQYDFTAEWTAASGGASYVIDVSTNSTFGGGAAVNLMSNGSFETGDSTDWDKFETNYSVVTTDPQEGTYHVAINATTTRDLTQNVSITGDGVTAYEISYWYKGTGNARIWASWTTGGQLSGDNLQPTTYNGNAADWTKMTYTVVPQSGANVLFYEIRTYNGASMNFDNFFVGKAGGAAPSYVAGYSNRAVASTSVSVTGLTDSVTYYFRVATVGDGGCVSSYTATENVTTLAGPPPQPTGLTASDGTDTAHVALSWTDVSAKETGYVIYRHTANVFGSATPIFTNAANVVTYNDATAAIGTLYYYWIVATNAIGNSAASTSDSGFRKLATVALGSASGCTDTNHVALSWTDIAGETGYGIWRDTDSNPAGGGWVGTAPANATSYNDITATPGTLYYYWVRATNSTLVTQSDFQASGASGVRKLATVAVSASDGTDTDQVVVNWTDIAGETSYSVWRSETVSSATAEWQANVAANATSYYDEEAVAGTQYYYWVRGTNATSGCYSDFGTGDGGWRRLVENPSSVEVTRDGREMVRAAIAANANTDDILVLHSTLAEVSGSPVLNSSYTVGDTLGNAKVIYTGTATNFLEHVVSANTTNHYRVFSVLSNIFYSSGTIPTGSPVETKAYQANVGVETFSYTNVTLSAASFTNKAGGANWATGSNWVLATSGIANWLVLPNDTYDDRPMFFTAASNQATISGNRAFADLNGAGRWANATRQLPTVSTGSVFVSALMAYRYEGSSEGTDRWLTIAMMNGTTEELEFGKPWGAHRTFTIRRSGANAASSYGMNPYGDSTNNWYWVVLKYDFENDIAKAKAFYRGENIPSTEPSTWDAEWSSMSIAQVTAVRLKAGSGTDWLGGGLFDEVRVSSVWPALLGEPDLIITPEEKNFGDTEVGRTDVQMFWVENNGGDKVPLSVTSLTLGGTHPTNFFLSTNTLGTIEYGQSNSFIVTFLPHALQTYSATLYLTNSSGVNPVTVALQGTGIPSQLTNAPAVDDYWVGVTNQVTDAMVTSGVFSVVIDAYHPAGIATAKYDLLNGASTVILANQAFESWTSANGEDFVFSNATHTGYWPATPADDYLVRVTLISSNGYGTTNTTYGVMGGVESTDLFISEYIEGSSYNKAIEIYNGTGAAVDLSSYTLRVYNNGATAPSSTIALSGTLAAGDVYVVAHSSASAAILAEANLTHGNLDFNGNDVVALAKSGVNIDVVGTIGSSAYFAKDVTKVRKSSVTDGVTTYDTAEWDNNANDTTSFLGAHTMDGGVAGTPMEFQVIDDDTEAPVITSPLVNGATTPAGTAVGPSIAIGAVPVGGFDLEWDIQDTGSGVFAASNHYTLTRSNVVISSGAVTTGSDGDGKASALAVSTTVPRASMIWGNYVLSLAGHDYDPEWVGDISSVSNVYYFVIAAPSIGVDPTSLDFGTVERNISSNLTLVVTNSGNADLDISSIGFTGTGNGYFSVTSPSVPLTVTPGDSAEVVVSFTPAAGGTFNNVVMTLNNTSPDHAEQEVPITAVCFDPETAPPSIYDFTAVDSRVVTNEVTDHALGHSDVTLNFTLWHYAGMSAAGASYDLLDPDGNLVWTNGTFDAMTGVTLGTKDCQVFSATVPGFYPAVTGVYTARVTATSSNAYSVTDEVAYAPLTAGGGVPHILDRFSRPNAFNDIGAGWLPTSTGETNKNIQLRDHTLQFYGAGGTAGAGRLSVVRDMTGRYNTVLTQNSGTLTWAFNFHSGQVNMTGLESAKYAGVFVLGSTSANFAGGSGDGYAVRICSNQVALVRFTGGLNSDSDTTTIGTPASLTASTPMGIRVDLDPATGAWTLYTTNWGGTGPDAFGDPLAAAELVTSNVDSTYLGAQDLTYVGCYWNHGAATPSSLYGAVFDDVYAPYVMPAAPLMNFTVVDEDWSAPVHSGFNVDGVSYPVTSLNPGGLTVTGLVADANGVYAGTSNVWTLFSNSTQIATGSMTMTPNTDGAGTIASPAALSVNIAFNYLNTTNGTFTFRLVSTDYDVDRPGDSLSITNTYTFYIVEKEAPTPTDVTAVGDGMEMAVLTWNLNEAKGSVVLYSSDSNVIDGAKTLTPGIAYNQGDAGPNGTTVAYHGTNQTGAEIVLPMGSLNYFRVFGANGTVYSTGYADPTNSVQLLEYESGEIVDQFAYTNNYIWTHGDGGTNWMYLNDQAGTGQGWDGGWTGDTHKALTIENINLLSGTTHYPDPYANKLQWVANSQVATNVAITRKLAAKRSGRTFIAFMMNYKVGTNSCSLTNKYLGLSLMSGTAADKEEIFFGKVHGYDKDGGIEVPGVATNVPASPDNYAFNAKHGDDYMIVGEWDPGIHTIRMWAFHQGDTNPIPQEYTNATPFVAYSNASLTVGDITGIRLAAGMSVDDTNSLDHVYFDEVRVGDTWDEVLLFNYPEAWNFRVGEQRGSGTNVVYVVTDGQLAEAGKAYPISYLLNHRTGVTNAQFNISTNTSYLTGLYDSNIDLELDPANATDRSRWFTNWVTTRLHTNDITLGVYTTRVWMTAVSGKATNTIFMEGRAGATDLFFGEFGEGRYWDKYVEIYNGTGGAIDLYNYFIAHQNYGVGIDPDYTKPWINFCRLSPTPHNLEHGKTMLILNGEAQNYSGTGATLGAMTNALIAAGREYLITTNDALQVSGNDPVGLFHESNTNDWIDMCGIAPDAGTRDRYIMRRLEDAEVPRSAPLVVATNQWDYRDWAAGTVVDSPDYTNFLATAGLYDRDVGLGGYITFTVEDDDTEPPRMGPDSALMVGTTAPYTSLAPSNGAVEVVLTAWNFVGSTVEEASRPWANSLLTNASVSCISTYTGELVNIAHGGTSENDLFDGIDQPNKGILEMTSIGTYFTQAETAWIQFEIELTSAEEMVLSWAEAGGSSGFDTAQLLWSSDGVNFSTNAAWPSWVPKTGGATTYATRFMEFDGVVTPGLSKVYIRIVLGPGYGTAAGTYRIDNVQLTGYPQEFQVTDGQIAASGNKFQFRANVYDTNSGLDKAQATMKLQSTAGDRVSSKDIGDGSTTNSTLWWELGVSRADITDYVNASLSGYGMTINVQVPDLDADRPNDQSWLNGRIGQVRVIDDDTKRPKLTLTSMKPLSSILAQWTQMTNTTSLLPTRSDAGVDVEPLKTQSGTDDPKNPNFSRVPTNGYYIIEAWAWHGQQKCWLIEITPEADMSLTNLTFTSYMHRTNGVSNYRIDHYVDGAFQETILTPTYWVNPPGLLDPDAWYTRSHGWAPDTVVLKAGKVNQIRIYGLGASNFGARWRISELTLWQAAMGTDGVTEVTDAEFTSGSFKLEGNAWDTGSGIASTTHATQSKRPMFSLNAPDGGVLVSNQLFAFTGEVADGGATTQEDGAFEGSLPTPIYTNVMLGAYTGEAHVWDNDDDRTDDALRLRGDLAMYVVDNDIMEPTTVGTLRVNDNEVPAEAPDRYSVTWTNQPEFIVSFDSVAVDQDPGVTYSDKQRTLTGIGEYRVATNADINTLSASNRATLGTPYPVAATNGALANYGFELNGEGWTLDANCSYRSLAVFGTNDVKEGTNSLRQVNGGVAHQTIEFRNTAGTAPIVGVSGWYRSDTVGGPTFRIEAFATNDLVTPVAVSNIQPGTAAAWTSFTGEPAALGDETVEVLKVSLIDGGGNTTFWDDIRLSVDVGANTPSMRFSAGTENQGLNPQYLFAVDGDNNRSGDRLAGEASPFYIAYDVTPPTKVGNSTALQASTDSVDDPTTQFDLQWSTYNVGPDNPADANHPTKVSTERDILSPWGSYKVYYGTFDPLDVPFGDSGPGTGGAFIFTNFIANSNYLAWSNVTWDSGISDPSATGTNYLAMTNPAQNRIRLYDLDFDQEYAVVVVGVDKAGNEGRADIFSWATNNTIKFALTRGWCMAKEEASNSFPGATTLTNALTTRAAALAWTASGVTNAQAGDDVTNLFTEVKKDYDLIYWDASSFRESAQNEWKLLGTVRSNWFVDDGGQGRKRGNLRFYRASYKDRWRKTRLDGTNVVAQRPIASEEIYAQHNVVMSPGQNFMALHGVPYSNTFEAVFGGTETFPGNDTALNATKVEFFTPGMSAMSTEQYYLNAEGRWFEMGTGGQDVTTNMMSTNFFNRGFSITLPEPLPEAYVVTNAQDWNQLDENNQAAVVDAMIWSPIAQVPTNAFSQLIHCGSHTTRPDWSETLVYNAVALRLPVAAHPSNMRLLESGFVSGRRGSGDEIYTMNTATKSPLQNTKIYCDPEGIWRFTRNNGLVPYNFFQPNDVIVIISRNWVGTGSWTWTYHPNHFYTLPNRWMGN